MSPTQSRPGTLLAVLNLKGGVGKTHTVWLLAGVCQERAKRLLVVDTDTQANLTRSLLPGGVDRPGIEVLFDPAADAEAAGLIRPTFHSYIDLIPSGPRLAQFDLSDQAAWEASDGHLSLAEVLAAVSLWTIMAARGAGGRRWSMAVSHRVDKGSGVDLLPGARVMARENFGLPP